VLDGALRVTLLQAHRRGDHVLLHSDTLRAGDDGVGAGRGELHIHRLLRLVLHRARLTGAIRTDDSARPCSPRLRGSWHLWIH